MRHLSPLSYPGGKSKAYKLIEPYIPYDVKTLVSPFFGGGGLELAFAADRQAKVKACDNFWPLINFWNHAKHLPNELADLVLTHHPITKERFHYLRDLFHYGGLSDFDKAALYFVLNKSSFGGSTFTGGFQGSDNRFSVGAIKKLREFDGSRIELYLADWSKIVIDATEFMYLDPPYYNEQKLYGDPRVNDTWIDHRCLAAMLETKDNWVMSYNHCDEIRWLYQKNRIIELTWNYSLSHKSECREILILSNNLSELPDLVA